MAYVNAIAFWGNACCEAIMNNLIIVNKMKSPSGFAPELPKYSMASSFSSYWLIELA